MKHAPAALSCAAIVAVFAVLAFYRPAPSYTLLAFDHGGDVYELDGDLSESDCLAAARAVAPGYAATYCEKEA